jgi:hypothetical protein
VSVQKPSLNTALSNWQQRASYYNQLGIPQSKWYDIATSDIQNVMNTGATPMSTPEVNAAMASQLAGRSIIGNPVHHPHGLFGDITHLISSAPSDIGGIITGFLPGMAHMIAHLPSEVTGTAGLIEHGDDPEWLTAHGYEDPRTGKSSWGQAMADLRNIAHDPLLDLIPGVADVANLTTGAGRQYLLSHPVTAALDVAPAGKLIGAGSRAALEAGEAGSITESLQAGKPLQAAGRGLQRASAHLPGETGARVSLAISSEAVKRLTDSLGVGDQATQVSRDYSELGRAYSRKIVNLVKPLDQAMQKLSLEDRNTVTQMALGFIPTTPEFEHIVLTATQLRDTLRQYGEQTFRATKGKDGLITRQHGKGRLTFSASDPIKRSIQRMDALTSKWLPASHRDRAQAMKAAVKAGDRVAKLEQELADARAHDPPLPTNRIERDLEDARAVHAKQVRRVVRVQTRHKALQANLAKHRKEYYERLHESGGSAEMQPHVEAQMRARLPEVRKSLYQMEVRSLDPLRDPTHPLYDPTTYEARVNQALTELNEHLDMMKDTSSLKNIAKAFALPAERLGNPKAMAYARSLIDEVRNDAVSSVLDLIAHGLDPIWLRHVDPGQETHLDSRYARRATIIPDHVRDITQYKNRVFNFAPQVNDIGLGLVSAARDLYSAKATTAFLTAISPHMKKVEDIEPQFIKLSREDINARRRLPTRSIAAHAQALFNEEWETIKPEVFGLQDWGGIGRFSKTDELVVPKWLATNLKSLMPKDQRGAHVMSPSGAYDKALKVFRFSVLTGPRHLVHVGIAGLVPLMMREPFSPLHFRSAIRILREVKNGEHEATYARLSKNLYDFTDGVYNKAVGHQLGGWMRQFWEQTGANVQQKMARLEETVSDMYRISAALAGESHGLDREEAISRANKVAVDMDDMAPFERTVVKHVFPFYGFTKFLFRFLLTYPVDHPYRVSILSRFANQEQQDWNSLIPEKFMMTLFLGTPDSHGNIKTVDMRNLNPFRSFSNDFTMTGFFQSLNPILTTPLTMRGFNVLSATGPLYPSLEYNANSGTLQAATPSGKDNLINAIQQFVPEIGALDHFVGLTDQMRILKRTNPAAYQATLYSQLNLPGVLSPPITVNLPYVEEKAEMDRYKAAAQAVSQYESGKPGPYTPTDYSVVPYQGQYVNPAAFEEYWNSLVAGVPSGVDPRSLMATPIRKTSQDPLELLTQLGQLPPPPPSHA